MLKQSTPCDAAPQAKRDPASEQAYLTDLWYLAAVSRSIRPGKMTGRQFMGQPVLIGRESDGSPFALRDLCPHRGVQLSKGRFDGSCLACPFHGWQFDAAGKCQDIPSLVDKASIDISKISVRSYPVVEQQGLIWIYLSDAPPARDADLGTPPTIPEIGDQKPRVVTPLMFETAIDNAIYGLLDAAHTPYVHESALWRRPSQIKAKTKSYLPSELGFTMKRHEPSSNSTIYKILGGTPTTEISFQIPGIRLEHIRIGRHHVCNLTTMMPVSESQTQVTNLLYWTNPLFNFLKPAASIFARRFLGQDQKIVALQNEAAAYNPKKMLIKDADTPQRWYLQLKREWRRVQAEGGEFKNPVKAATLRWCT